MAGIDVSDFKQYDDYPELQDFQYNGINYLYNLEPQNNNLFLLDSFYDPYMVYPTDTFEQGSKKPSNMEYRLRKVSGWSLPSLTTAPQGEGGKPFKWTYVSGGKSENNITIEWEEDVFWTVKRYHINWMNHWYNKYLDCMIVGQSGKFRNMVLYLYHYKNVNSQTAVPIQKAVPVARIEFKGLVPKSMPSPELAWGEPGSSSVAIQYVYNYIEMFFYPYTKSEQDFIGGLANIVQTAKNYEKTEVKSVWNTGIVGLSDTRKDLSLDTSVFKDCADVHHNAVYYL